MRAFPKENVASHANAAEFEWEDQWYQVVKHSIRIHIKSGFTRVWGLSSREGAEKRQRLRTGM
jgi:hypothetical protein